MKKNAYILVVLAGILWGTSGIFVHYLAPLGFTPLHFTCVRAVVSAVCMTLYALVRNRDLFRAKPKDLVLFALSGLSIFSTATSYYISMQKSSVSTAVVLMYTSPIMVMAFSVAFFGEKMTKLKAVATVCMLLGCVLVSGLIGGLKINTLGIVFGLISGVSYSAYNIFTKIQMRKGCNPVSASMYCFIFMSLISLAVCEPCEIVTIAKSAPLWASFGMLLCGLATCIVPYFLYTLALNAIPAGTASSLSIIEPMAATVFSVTLLGERLSIFSLCGIIMVLGAVFLLSKSDG